MAEQPQQPQSAPVPVHAHVGPAAISWSIDVMQSNQGPIVAVRVEHLTGSNVFFFSPDDLIRFAEQLASIGSQARSGLQIAPADVLRGLPPLNGRGPAAN